MNKLSNIYKEKERHQQNSRVKMQETVSLTNLVPKAGWEV
jgi:hypothetical protein